MQRTARIDAFVRRATTVRAWWHVVERRRRNIEQLGKPTVEVTSHDRMAIGNDIQRRRLGVLFGGKHGADRIIDVDQVDVGVTP